MKNLLRIAFLVFATVFLFGAVLSPVSNVQSDVLIASNISEESLEMPGCECWMNCTTRVFYECLQPKPAGCKDERPPSPPCDGPSQTKMSKPLFFKKAKKADIE